MVKIKLVDIGELEIDTTKDDFLNLLKGVDDFIEVSIIVADISHSGGVICIQYNGKREIKHINKNQIIIIE
jgi:hypothetical protein